MEAELEPPAQAAAGQKPGPYLVRFKVTPGPLYTFADLGIELTGKQDAFAPPRLEELGLKTGEAAKAQAVLDAEQKLHARARKAGHALATLGRRSTVIDPEQRSMEVVLRLEPGA